MFKGIEIKYGLRMNDSLLMNVPLVFFFMNYYSLQQKHGIVMSLLKGKNLLNSLLPTL